MATMKLKVGDKAPEFCLPDKDDKQVCLKDYAGRWVVLYFYPKDRRPDAPRRLASLPSGWATSPT